MSLPISTKEVPFFKFIIPLLVGILYQYYFELFASTYQGYPYIIISLCLVLISFFFSGSWSFRWVFGVAIFLFLFISGAVFTSENPSTIKQSTKSKAIIMLLDKPQVRSKSFRVSGEVRYVESSNGWYPEDETLMLYFNLNDTLVENLTYGSLISTTISPNEIPSPSNPNQFNFKKYLAYKGIKYSTYIEPSSWVYISNKGNYVKKVAFKLSNKLIELFKTSGLKDDELAVASALTIGYKELLDDELKKVYSSSGTMHILAVSGMHVAILYYLLSYLLIFFNRKKSLKILKALILLIFLWFFAIISGFSPSVQRAALMFSFVVIGESLSRKISVYNSLAASAFLLLAINPNNLFDTGFQLSYIAVLAIVYFYPLIEKLFYTKNKFIGYLWSLTAVSVAAQIGTFSICIFYFNQFPNYFLISNLVAIPLSTIAMYLAVLLIIVSPISILSVFIGKMLSISIYALNNSLKIIEELPFSTSNWVYIDNLQLIIVLTFITLFAVFIVRKNTKYIYLMIALLCGFQLIGIYRTIANYKTNELVVFNIPKQTLISIKQGNNHTFFYNDSLNHDILSKYGFYINGYLNTIGSAGNTKSINLRNIDYSNVSVGLAKSGVFITELNGKSILYFYNYNLFSKVSSYKLDVDIVIVDNSTPFNFLNFVNPKLVIVSPSFRKKYVEKLQLQCIERGIEFYNVAQNIAFRKSFI